MLPLHHHHCCHHCCYCHCYYFCCYYHCFYCCCSYCIQMRFSFSKQTIVKLVWMSLIALQPVLSFNQYSVFRIHYSACGCSLSCSVCVYKKSVEQKTFMHNFPIKFLIITRRIDDCGKCIASTFSILVLFFFQWLLIERAKRIENNPLLFFTMNSFLCTKHVQTSTKHTVLCHLHRLCYPTRIGFDLNFALSGN